MLGRGAVSHCHLEFHRDAIEVYLRPATPRACCVMPPRSRTNASRTAALVHLFAARGRALAGALRGPIDEGLRDELTRIRSELSSAGFKPYLVAVDAVLAT